MFTFVELFDSNSRVNREKTFKLSLASFAPFRCKTKSLQTMQQWVCYSCVLFPIPATHNIYNSFLVWQTLYQLTLTHTHTHVEVRVKIIDDIDASFLLLARHYVSDRQDIVSHTLDYLPKLLQMIILFSHWTIPLYFALIRRDKSYTFKCVLCIGFRYFPLSAQSKVTSTDTIIRTYPPFISSSVNSTMT